MNYHFKILSYKSFVISTLVTMLLFVILMPPAGFLMKFGSYLTIFLINIIAFTGKSDISLTDKAVDLRWTRKPLLSKLTDMSIPFEEISEFRNSGNIAGEKISIRLRTGRTINFVIIDTVSVDKDEFIGLIKERLQASR